MANIMDYLIWRGDMNFRTVPFNEVDNLILALIVYLDLEDIVPGIDSIAKITIEEAAELYFEMHSPEEVENMPRLTKSCSYLLAELAETARFADCYLSNYVNDISVEEESQFSALKVDLDDGSVYISFSGTDHSVVGWKENFNMSFLAVTPGQLKAVQYVEQTVPFYKNKLRFGGHSKGGNLAVYAAMHARKSIQKRLLGIYNNDGPGFTNKMISEEGYQRILTRIHTYLPQSSVVGMLLEHEEDIDVIKSDNQGIMQHDAFSWEIIGAQFVHLDELQEDSIFLDGTLKKWVYSLEEVQRQEFVDALFEILDRAHIEDTDALQNLTLPQFMSLMKAADGLPPESKEVLKKTIKRLFESWIEMVTKKKKSK